MSLEGLNLKETYTALGLSDGEYDRILELMGRPPNFLELSLFSVMWSEHCGYKNSRPLLARFPNEGARVLQGPGENAGVVEVGDGWALAFKMESHNHPSAVEPYQGSATGVGGIIRDILAMGARPVAVLDSLRFGDPEDSRVRYLFREVVRGVGGYGNPVGVPTVGGEVEFAPAYTGNPLVNAMCIGLIRVEELMRSRATGVGNKVVLIGAKTGRDGIHGATFASDELSEESESRRSNVQVGDPFAEKMLIEACLQMLERDLLVALQDLGAAGLTSSAAEMAEKGGVGIEIDAEQVPLRESGMEPWEVAISESQERMLAVVEPERVEEVLALAERWELESAVIGRVADHGELRFLKDGEVAGSVPAEYLADAPTYERDIGEPEYLKEVQRLDLKEVPVPEDLGAALVRLVGHPNLRSRRSVWEQYDHMVQTNTVSGPGSDAAVIRIKGTGRAFAATTDGRGKLCYLDPERGGRAAVAEAYRNLSCVGAEPVAITDCLNFGSPEKPAVYYQLAKSIEGMATACEAFETPVVSGNVSLYNETAAGAIYPTPVVGMVGVLEDASRHATLALGSEGDVLVGVGAAREASLSGSEYLEVVHGRVAGRPPEVDLAEERRVADLVRELVRSGLVRSAHDVSGGGELVAVAEMALAGGVGVEYSEQLARAKVAVQGGGRSDVAFFGEGGARFLVSVPAEQLEELEAALGENSHDLLGRVGGDSVKIPGFVSVKLSELRAAHERDLFAEEPSEEVR